MARARKALTGISFSDDSVEAQYNAAEEKAQDPAMTTADNPLAMETHAQAVQNRVVRRNMNQLYEDAHKRRSSAVYDGLMNMRYGR